MPAPSATRSPAPPQFVVGIDLGTTNSALAYVALNDSARQIHAFPVPQLVSAGAVAERPTLPSFLYIGGEHDIGPGSLALPWDMRRDYAVGELARSQGARVPGRLVSSAKSWLCHGGVDREAAILPWGGSPDVPKLSPVEAAARYVQHLREAWQQRFPDAPLEAQHIVLTVPASFDEVARELTVAAAERAGLTKFVLLEEPQAAFYAWIHRHEETWQDALAQVALILVVDIGGGTTDFSLIAVKRVDDRLGFERLAVGDHLLLGGDNIDVALARTLEPRLGTRLDSQRWHALASVCREAKETLLGSTPPDEVPVSIVGRGSAVVGGLLTAALARSDVERLVLEGFFPLADADAEVRRSARVGLQEWGLPFASDPEVPRHLAQFLRRHRTAAAAASGTGAAEPDAVLFNGGALKPAVLRQRLRDQLAHWSGGRPPTVLESVDLDLAVARGAAYYGLVRRGRGIRIAGGAARSYYIGLRSEVAPEADTVRALCVVHRGMEEGEEIEVAEPAMEVIANRGVSFPLYASSTRLGEHAGQVVEAERDTLTELPPIRTVLRFGRKLHERTIPVHIQSRLTEIGTLEVWCRSLATDHRWRLQFQLRDTAVGTPAAESVANEGQQAESVVSTERLAAAAAALRAVFPAAGATAATEDPVSLVRVLEERIGAGKDAWPLAAVRKLWDVLWEGQEARGVSPQHEARWLNLSGFLLRPGFGSDTDGLRLQQLWRLKSQGMNFPRGAQCRAEWWNMWKRVAGGLTRQQQQQLYTEVAPYLLPRLKTKARNLPRVGPQEVREYWQLVASCERLSAETKAELGAALLPALSKGKGADTDLWALGRLGARAPLYGPLNCVVGRSIAAAWVDALLAPPASRADGLAFALVQLARCVGDRERDLDGDLRRRIAERLRPLRHGERAARLVLEHVPLEGTERAQILDESLPVGLQLREE